MTAPSPPGGRVRFLGLAAALSALALLTAGAVVNSSQAALSIPDWPRSYGRWILIGVWTGNTVVEHVHRLLAAFTGLLLAPWLWLTWRAAGTVQRRAIAVTGGLYAAQVLMGGAVVLLLNPSWLSALHAVVAVSLVCLVLALALEPWGLWSEASAGQPPATRKAHRLASWSAGLLAAQLVLGALSRHPETQAALIAALLTHLANGLAIVLLLPVAAISIARGSRGTTRWLAACLGLFLVLQITVAMPLLVISPEPLAEEWPPPPGFVLLHAAHVVLAALLIFTSIALAVRVRKSALRGATH